MGLRLVLDHANPHFLCLKARVAFYLRMISMEDLNFQRNGSVFVVLADNFDSFTDLNIARWQGGVQRHGRLADALPGSTHCVHICFPRNGSYRSFLYSWVIKMLVSVLNPLWKLRVRIHRGTVHGCYDWTYKLFLADSLGLL